MEKLISFVQSVSSVFVERATSATEFSFVCRGNFPLHSHCMILSEVD